MCMCESVEVGFCPGNGSDCAYEEHVHPPVDVYDVCGGFFLYEIRQRIIASSLVVDRGPTAVCTSVVTFLPNTRLISAASFARTV